MRTVRSVTLIVLSLLIAPAVFVGEVAFRMDMTVLRHAWLQTHLESWLEPIHEPAHHEEFVDELLDEIRAGLGWSIPGQILPLARDAAREAYTPDWLVSFALRTHTALFRIMRGDRTPVRLTLPLGRFTTALSSAGRAALPVETSRGLDLELSRVPAAIDLLAALSPDQRARFEATLRRVPLASVLLQYALPGLLIALTLVFRRPGSAMISSGAGVAGGGLLMLAFAAVYRTRAAAVVAATVRGAVPGRPAWIVGPVAESADTVVSSSVPFALLLVGIGAVIVALGTVVVRRWGDSLEPLMRTTRDALRA